MNNMLSYVPGLSKLVGLASRSQAVDVPKVEVHHIETDPERRARCLKHLLKANHVNYSITNTVKSNEKTTANRLPHVLISAYLLGASVERLNEIYDAQIKHLGPWQASPAELDEDWAEFWGDDAYTRAYVDFFEDKLAMEFAYDWKKVVMHFLFTTEGSRPHVPLIHRLIGDGGSAIVSLANAFETDSKELAMEGLGLASIYSHPLSKYLEGGEHTRWSSMITGRFEDMVGHMQTGYRSLEAHLSQGIDNDTLSADQEQLLLQYWYAWGLEDPTTQFENAQKTLVQTLLTAKRPEQNVFDRGLAQLLVTSHAVRVLLPSLPTERHVPLLRQWWLLAIATLLRDGGPQKSEWGLVIDLAGKDWRYVQSQAVSSLPANDELSLQVVRAIQVTASTWGDSQARVLAAAVTFVDNFKRWS